MVNNELKLLKIQEEAQEYFEESKRLFRIYINNEYSHLKQENEEWLKNRRKIDPALFINKFLCSIEGVLLKGRNLEVTLYAGAAAAISDDLLDKNGTLSPDRLSLFTQQKKTLSKRESLFNAFNSKLIKLLPPYFPTKFDYIIQKYNQVQIDTIKLFNPEIDKEDIVNIKDRAGGYSILLLHNILFPERRQRYQELNEKYSPYSVPNSVTQALYNFGSWLSRVDDLWDRVKDSEQGMKQLATEDCITWDRIQPETKEVFENLTRFYLPSRVNNIHQEYFEALVDKSLFEKYGSR